MSKVKKALLVLICAGGALLAAPVVAMAYAVDDSGARIARATLEPIPAAANTDLVAPLAVTPTPAPPLPHLAPLPSPQPCDNCSKLQPTLLPPPTSDVVTLDYVVTAGTKGAFAYCNRGALAYTPCSLAYYVPGQRVRVNVIPQQLGDGGWYWVTALTFYLPQYGSSVTYAAYIPQSQAG